MHENHQEVIYIWATPEVISWNLSLEIFRNTWSLHLSQALGYKMYTTCVCSLSENTHFQHIPLLWLRHYVWLELLQDAQESVTLSGRVKRETAAEQGARGSPLPANTTQSKWKSWRPPLAAPAEAVSSAAPPPSGSPVSPLQETPVNWSARSGPWISSPGTIPSSDLEL